MQHVCNGLSCMNVNYHGTYLRFGFVGGVITTTPNYEDITGTGSPTPPPFETGTTTMQPAFTTG